MKLFLILLGSLCFTAYSQTIAEIQGGADSSPFAGMSVNTQGIVTAVHNLGYFIQDGPYEWSGIYVYDQSNSPQEGDEIALTALVEEYFGLTELKSVSSFEILSSGNDIPQPIAITTAEANDEAFEGVLVRVLEATCTNNNLGFGEYEINDGSGTCMGDDLLHPHTLNNGVVYTITGPLYYSFGNYKIVPRYPGDIEIALPLYFTVEPGESSIAATSITFQWETNIPANSTIEYGLTTAYEMGAVSDAAEVTQHALSIEGLSPATIYEVRIFSQSGQDITPFAELTVCTASESSGVVNVYFNHITDTSVATAEDAVWTLSVTDTIIAYIQEAQSSLDLALYDLLGAPQSIFEAINDRHSEGVRVRYITDDEPLNGELDWLDPSIPVLRGNTGGLMHNKFIVIDAGSVWNSWVLTGSTNHTWANLGWDYNNLICIQDQSLARTFEREFEEMWGGSGDSPNEGNARFGAMKTDNTPHYFNISGVPAEAWFSPSDGTTERIRRAIAAAEHEIAFAVLVFTENALGTAIGDAHASGVHVEGIIDYVEFAGSEFDYLLEENVDVMDYQNEDGTQWPDGPTLHHKYMIADFEPGRENPVLITGSHNWSASANSVHDENIVIFHDHRLANLYFQEFSARRAGLSDSLITSTALKEEPESFMVYPNPCERSCEFNLNECGNLSIINASGQVVYRGDFRPGTNRLDVSWLSSGVYLFRWQGEEGKSITCRVLRR